MKINLIVLTIFILCLAQGKAQMKPDSVPMKFTLAEAKEYALQNSPVLLNSARDVEIAKKKIWETTATGLPQVNLSSSYTHTPQLSGFTDAITSFPGFEDLDINDLKTTFFASIQVNQLIFSGQYIVGLRASKIYKNLSELATSKSEIGIIENITNTYFTALISRESKNVLDSSLISVQKTLYETEQLLANGLIENTDVDQLKILVSNIKSSLSVTERQIELMERLLKFQMGISIEKTIILTDEIDPLMNILNIEALKFDSFDVKNNVDYLMASTQEKLMKLNMQAQQAQFLPVLSGYYQRYEDLDDNFFNDQSANTLGLTLSLPLFTSGQRLSQVSQRKVEYLKAKTDKEMAEENLMLQYETALSDFLSSRDIYAMRKESRDLALRIYKKSIIKFSEGVGSSLDLNETQSQYFTADGEYYNALFSLISAKTKLESLQSGTVK